MTTMAEALEAAMKDERTKARWDLVARVLLLMAVGAFLAIGGAIAQAEVDQANQAKRANAIECIRLDNEGTDSIGARDREACP